MPRPSSSQSAAVRSAAHDVHPMYALVRRHGRLSAAGFLALVRTFRAHRRATPDGSSDDGVSDLMAERLLATYVPLLSAMVGRKSPQGSAGTQFREGATAAAIAAFFETIGDPDVELAPRTLHNAINERVTRALESELLSVEHALVVSAQSAWRAANVVRTAASVSGEDVDWLTRDEVYAILGDSIRVESIHLVQSSKSALGLRQRAGGGDDGSGWEPGTVGVDVVPTSTGSRDQATGAAAIAAERLARALATLPATDARLIVDVHGLFGRKPVLVADVATALGIHPSTCRRMVNRAEALLRSAVAAQADRSTDTDGDRALLDAPVRGAWCAANSAQMRRAYQDEMGSGLTRYARRIARAVLRFAEHEGWSAAETEAAVRRLVSFRTGRADASDHPLTLETVAFLQADLATRAAPRARAGDQRSAGCRSAAEPSTLESALHVQREECPAGIG